MADDYGRITGVPQNPDDYSRIIGVEAKDDDFGRIYWRAKIKLAVAMAVVGCGIILVGLAAAVVRTTLICGSANGEMVDEALSIGGCRAQWFGRLASPTALADA